MCNPATSSYFGTSPEPWNYLLKGMTLLPDSIMGNRDLMQALAEFSEPLVRLTDKLVSVQMNGLLLLLVLYCCCFCCCFCSLSPQMLRGCDSAGASAWFFPHNGTRPLRCSIVATFRYPPTRPPPFPIFCERGTLFALINRHRLGRRTPCEWRLWRRTEERSCSSTLMRTSRFALASPRPLSPLQHSGGM